MVNDKAWLGNILSLRSYLNMTLVIAEFKSDCVSDQSRKSPTHHFHSLICLLATAHLVVHFGVKDIKE
jgi:hypothetical protein